MSRQVVRRPDVDTQLMFAAKRGDQAAFERLYSTYQQRVIDFIAARYGAHGYHELEDMVQEVFLRAWRRREDFRGDASALTYLLAIAKNVVREYCRAAKHRPHATSICRNDDRLSVEDQCDRKKLVSTVAQALSSLSQRQQEAIRLVLVEGRSTTEAARLVESSSNAIRHRMNAALRHLRGALSLCSARKCPHNGPLPPDCPAECSGSPCVKQGVIETF